MNHVYIALIIFIAALVVFHVLLYTLCKDCLSSFWRKTDYVWLSLAVIGLVGVAERFQNRQLNAEIESIEIDLQDEYLGQQSWFLTLIVSETRAVLSEIESRPRVESTVRTSVSRRLSRLHYLADLQLSLATNRPYIAHQNELLEEVQHVRAIDRFSNAASEAEYMIKRAIPDEARLAKLRRDSASVWASSQIFVVLPFGLAIALALRLTKVTAELRLSRKEHNKSE